MIDLLFEILESKSQLVRYRSNLFGGPSGVVASAPHLNPRRA
jgi:hypothetical protein